MSYDLRIIAARSCSMQEAADRFFAMVGGKLPRTTFESAFKADLKELERLVERALRPDRRPLTAAAIMDLPLVRGSHGCRRRGRFGLH